MNTDNDVIRKPEGFIEDLKKFWIFRLIIWVFKLVFKVIAYIPLILAYIIVDFQRRPAGEKGNLIVALFWLLSVILMFWTILTG